MPDINSIQVPRTSNRLMEVYAFLWTTVHAITNALALNGDRIRLLQVTRAMRVVSSNLNISGTLGALATVQLQRDRAGVYTNMTVATTAGAASVVNSSTLGIIDLAVDDFVVLLVAGANIGAAATATLDMLVQTN